MNISNLTIKCVNGLNINISYVYIIQMDPYKTLGIAKNASTKEIKDSYRKLWGFCRYEHVQ